MTTQRQRLESYYALPGVRDLQVQAECLHAADAIDAAMALGRISTEQLQVVVDAVSSPRVGIWQTCKYFLTLAAERWPEAADALLEMTKNPKAHVRFNTLCCLERTIPQHIIDTMLRAGLVDRSARVRWKAADLANSLEQRHLIPEIGQAAMAETNPKAKSSIEFDLRFLRDGYILTPKENGSFSVSIRLHNGGTGFEITEADLKSKGINAIVAETRERHAREDARLRELQK